MVISILGDEESVISAITVGATGYLLKDAFPTDIAATVRDLGIKLPMQAGKGYSVTHPKPRQLPQLCSIFTEARVAVTPMGNTLRIGGTMDSVPGKELGPTAISKVSSAPGVSGK